MVAVTRKVGGFDYQATTRRGQRAYLVFRHGEEKLLGVVQKAGPRWLAMVTRQAGAFTEIGLGTYYTRDQAARKLHLVDVEKEVV